jgi:hypothetical protein
VLERLTQLPFNFGIPFFCLSAYDGWSLMYIAHDSNVKVLPSSLSEQTFQYSYLRCITTVHRIDGNCWIAQIT